jgi:hypothetical protein
LSLQGFLAAPLPRLPRPIDRLERQVDFLFRTLGIDPAAALYHDGLLPPAFYDALSRDKPIVAIKIYRQVMGCGLREAKVAVDAMRPGVPLKRRDRRQSPWRSSGPALDRYIIARD